MVGDCLALSPRLLSPSQSLSATPAGSQLLTDTLHLSEQKKKKKPAQLALSAVLHSTLETLLIDEHSA